MYWSSDLIQLNFLPSTEVSELELILVPNIWFGGGTVSIQYSQLTNVNLILIQTLNFVHSTMIQLKHQSECARMIMSCVNVVLIQPYFSVVV